MPSEAQLVRLGELVREAQCWWRWQHASNGRSLGAAIELAEELLRPWLRNFLEEHLGGGTKTTVARDLVDDVLSEVSVAVVKDFSAFQGSTGKEFYGWLHKMAEHRVADLERRRHARRRRGADQAASLDRDQAAARLAGLLEDDSPSAEAVAMLNELKVEVRRAMKGLTVNQRRVARAVMDGVPMARIIAAFGPTARADWRAAAAHVRRVLEGRAPRRRRKPK